MLFNQIYNTEKFSTNSLVIFLSICEGHRLISLMSHTLKVSLEVIHYKISVESPQIGFRRGLVTREALVATQVLVQKCYDQRKEAAMCFIDYRKAFDRVTWRRLKRHITLSYKGIENPFEM